MDKFNIFSLMFLILQGLIPETIADCSAEQLSISNVISPRAGIHYVVKPNSDYASLPSPSSSSSSSSPSPLSSSPQSECPSGSSLTYIKSQEEWEDWKSIRGMYQCFKL